MIPIRKIAIIGATGMLGKPVARALVEAGFQVTALVRSPEKAKQLLPSSMQLMQANLKDLDSLKTALQGQDALYLNLSVEQTERESDFHAEGEGLRNAIEAAKATDMARISYLSSIVMRYQTDWWVIKLKREAAASIKASGIPYTIFYPSNFMETLDGRMLQGNKIMTAGKALHPNWWIAGQDYGRQVANDLKREGRDNREYVVQGPEPIRMEEAAARFVKAYPKRSLSVAGAPIGLMKFLSYFTPRFKYVYEISNALNQYPEKFEAQQTWDDLGKPTTNLEDYARSL